MKQTVDNMTLQEQAKAILEKAEKKGISTNFLFVTTFKRYQVQLKLLSEIEQQIQGKNSLNYVAIDNYNRTSTAANATAKALSDLLSRSEERED